MKRSSRGVKSEEVETFERLLHPYREGREEGKGREERETTGGRTSGVEIYVLSSVYTCGSFSLTWPRRLTPSLLG